MLSKKKHFLGGSFCSARHPGRSQSRFFTALRVSGDGSLFLNLLMSNKIWTQVVLKKYIKKRIMAIGILYELYTYTWSCRLRHLLRYYLSIVSLLSQYLTKPKFKLSKLSDFCLLIFSPGEKIVLPFGKVLIFHFVHFQNYYLSK